MLKSNRNHHVQFLAVKALTVFALQTLYCTGACADDCIKPSSAVVTNVKLREAPNTSSAILGQLKLGQKVLFVDDQSSWYKAESMDGTIGFLSKQWTVKIACSATDSTSSVNAIETAPVPLLAAHHDVAWWFVFKFNAASFPGCSNQATRQCRFGGSVQGYAHYGEQYAVASSEKPNLEMGASCAGETLNDPVGATFDEIYNGKFHYVVWNDQFYDDPVIQGCSSSCGSPWGHSKGLIAWNDQGVGMVMQVSTPSWPAAGSTLHPRLHDGNTLGCVSDNDVLVSQHFFALSLSKDDVVAVLKGLINASVVTDINNPQVVNDGGPTEITDLVSQLGTKSRSASVLMTTLSTGVQFLSKPSALHVPPWQMVSAELGGQNLRVASWWANPKIPSTTETTTVGCWDSSLGTPGAVDIATSGEWDGTTIGLKGIASLTGNHAKIGVSTQSGSDFVIFGDLNQQGSLSGDTNDCKRSQNGRGGTFYVVHNHDLSASITGLLSGESAAP